MSHFSHGARLITQTHSSPSSIMQDRPRWMWRCSRGKHGWSRLNLGKLSQIFTLFGYDSNIMTDWCHLCPSRPNPNLNPNPNPTGRIARPDLQWERYAVVEEGKKKEGINIPSPFPFDVSSVLVILGIWCSSAVELAKLVTFRSPPPPPPTSPLLQFPSWIDLPIFLFYCKSVIAVLLVVVVERVNTSYTPVSSLDRRGVLMKTNRVISGPVRERLFLDPVSSTFPFHSMQAWLHI